jgi:hypothetical protein
LESSFENEVGNEKERKGEGEELRVLNETN